MINLYCGRSDVDRGKFIYEKAAWYKAEGKSSAVIIVPDQYTLEAERDAFRVLKTKGLMDIQVMSFSRLALKLVGEKTGKKYIDDTGRSMILRKVISEKKERLGVFAPAAEKNQFIRMMGSMIQEFKQYKVSPERLWDIVALNKEKYTDRMLIKKLEDGAVIYSAYEEALKGRYFDTEDYISRLCEEIPDSEIFDNASVWVEGFDFFTKRLMTVIEQVVLKARDINISLTYSAPGCRDYNLFAPVEATINDFKTLGRNIGTEVNVFNIPEEYIKKQNEDIKRLQNELYAFPIKAYDKVCPDVKLYSCENKEAEISVIASEIRRLVDEEGYRYRDITIAANDLGYAGSLMDRYFSDMGIKFFDGRKVSAVFNKYMQFILALCGEESIYNSNDRLFRILHTHILNIDADEAEILENYVIRYGIKGSMWKNNFHKIDERGISEEEIKCKIDHINDIRQRLVSALDCLYEKMEKCRTGKEFCETFFEYLKDTAGMDEMISLDADRLKSEGYFEYAGLTVQLWNRMVSVLGQFSEIFGDSECDSDMFFEVLRSGIETMEISLIPTTADQVYVGGYTAGGFGEIKILFATGLNDGTVPSSGSGTQILSEHEKKKLNEIAGEICLQTGSRSEREKLEIYKTFSLPSEKLYMSYCNLSEDGEEQNPSQLLGRIHKIYPELETADVVSEDVTRKGEAAYNSRMEYMKMHAGKSSGVLFAEMGEKFENNLERISSKNFTELYGKVPKMSPTSLESFSRCPYAHFLRHGLRADERKVFEISPPEMGTIFHEALMKFSEYISDKKMWDEVDEALCSQLMGELAEAAAREFKKGLMFEGPVGEYRISRVRSVCESTAYMIAEHIRQGGFDKFSFEVPFGDGQELSGIDVSTSNGGRVVIEGRIDRIDVAETDNGTYVKVIDYKSGDEKVSRSEVLSGYKMQLMLYMTAAMGVAGKIYSDVAPAGVFYFHIHEPVADGNSAKPKDLEDFEGFLDTNFKKSFKMEGIVVNEPEIIEILDQDFKGFSQIVRVRKLKDGSVKGTGDFSALTKTEFYELMQSTAQKTEYLCNEFTKGSVHVSPLKISDDSGACSYCKYKSICNFDVRLPGFEYRKE